MTMKITKEEIIEEISKMNILEIIELTKLMEQKFQINLQLNCKEDLMKQDLNGEKVILENSNEKKNVSIILESPGVNKIMVIKEVKTILEINLKEAKDLVEAAPIKLKENVVKEHAENIKEILEKVGATVTLK